LSLFDREKELDYLIEKRITRKISRDYLKEGDILAIIGGRTGII